MQDRSKPCSGASSTSGSCWSAAAPPIGSRRRALAERVDGGWRVNAQKIFASGIPRGDLFMTQAVYDDPQAGPTALHFALPIKGPGVEPQETWQRARNARDRIAPRRHQECVRAGRGRLAQAPRGPVDSAVSPLCLHHSAAAHLRGLSRDRGGGARRRAGACTQATRRSRTRLSGRRDGERACGRENRASRHGGGGRWLRGAWARRSQTAS